MSLTRLRLCDHEQPIPVQHTSQTAGLAAGTLQFGHPDVPLLPDFCWNTGLRAVMPRGRRCNATWQKMSQAGALWPPSSPLPHRCRPVSCGGAVFVTALLPLCHGGRHAPQVTPLADGNKVKPCRAAISAVDFHPGGQLLLTAGKDKRLSIFQVPSAGILPRPCATLGCCVATRLAARLRRSCQIGIAAAAVSLSKLPPLIAAVYSLRANYVLVQYP